MSKIYDSSYVLTVGAFDVNEPKPLDTRYVVSTKEDLYIRSTFGSAAYEGMIVYVDDIKELYILKHKPTSPKSWSTDIVWEKFVEDTVLNDYLKKEDFNSDNILISIDESNTTTLTDTLINIEQNIDSVEERIFPLEEYIISPMENYVSKEYLESKHYLTEHQSLEGYAKITDIPSLDGYATESWVEDKGYLTEHQSLEGYAKITDIPSLEGYATESWVEDKHYLTEHQSLDGYAKLTDIPSLDGYAKLTDVISMIDELKVELGGKSTDYIYVSGYEIGSTPTYITYMKPFVLNDDVTTIEVQCGDELMGYDDVYATLFSYDIPDGYNVDVYFYNSQASIYNVSSTTFMSNPASSTKLYGDKTYKSFVRRPDDGKVNSDLVLMGPNQYKIIVTKI